MGDRVKPRGCRALVVLGAGGGHHHVAQAGVDRPLGEVDVLVPQEKTGIEAAELPPQRSPHHEARPTGLVDLDGSSVQAARSPGCAERSEERADEER